MLRELTLRPPGPGDVEAIAAMVNELGQFLHGEDTASADEVRQWLSGPNRDPQKDALLAVLADGTVAGFATVADFTEDHSRLFLFSALHPQHRTMELGDELLDPLERRAAELAAPGAVLNGFTSSANEFARELFEARGYRLVRHSFRMVIDLAERPPEPDWPPGIELRPFDPDSDAERVYEADMDAFADHWGFVRTSFEDWRHWTMQPPFDPSLWFLAYEGDELAGLCLCRSVESGDPDMGWVSVLGVPPRWRRRGLGTALLHHAFAEFYRRGRKRAGLGVDAENTTGAVALYERAGMRVRRRSDTYEKAL